MTIRMRLLPFLLLLLPAAVLGETLPFFDDVRKPSETLIETLLFPGEFSQRRFVRVSTDSEADFCLDSSLSATEPFAQVYPERLRWPDIGGVPLVVDKLDLRLLPQGRGVTDALLDEGFSIRWLLVAMGSDFSTTPAFRMRVVGAEVLSDRENRVIFKWSEPDAPDICSVPVSPDVPTCHLRNIGLEARAVALHPDADLLAVAYTGLKPRVEMYRLEGDPSLIWQSTFPVTSGGVIEVAFSADGRYVVALLGNGRTHRFLAASGGGHLPIPSQGIRARSVPPGRTVAVVGDGGELVLWRLSDGTIDWRVPPREFRGRASRVAVSGDGRRIAVLEFEGRETVIRLFEVNRRRGIAQWNLRGVDYADMALDESGERIFLSHERHGLMMMPVAKQTTPAPFGASGAVCRGPLEWIHGGKRIACSIENGIHFFRSGGEMDQTFSTGKIFGQWLTAVSPDGDTTVAVGSGHLLIWR